jgi:4-carboxymuconolactone decarboxylase
LNDRSREIAILEVARLHRSNFEFYAHASVGLNAGLTGDEIGALAAGSGCASFDAKEDLIREATRSLVESHDLNDALYARAVAGLSEVVVADLVVLVGFYEYTALALRVFRVPLPVGVSPTFAGGDA